MKKTLTTTTMLLEDANGEDQEINIEGYVHHYVELAYGADADGHRGISRVFVDDVTDIGAYDQDGEEIELSSDDIERAGELLTEEFLEEGL